MDDVQRQKVGWGNEQWAAIDSAVAAEVTGVRVVDEVIPTTTVGANEKTVTVDRINPMTRRIDDETTIPLSEISVRFSLDKQQVQQPELTRALAMIRRAASDFARLEDAVLLRGLTPAAPNGYQPDGVALPPESDIQRGQNRAQFDGLAGSSARNVAINPTTGQRHMVQVRRDGVNFEPNILGAFARAIVLLESAGHMGPYQLILGNDAFVEVLTPNPPNPPALDRIERLLASPIRRCPSLEPNEGVLLSTRGDPNDRVVAVQPTVRFETTQEDRYVFRLYGVLALRRKEPAAAVALEFIP